MPLAGVSGTHTRSGWGRGIHTHSDLAKDLTSVVETTCQNGTLIHLVWENEYKSIVVSSTKILNKIQNYVMSPLKLLMLKLG